MGTIFLVVGLALCGLWIVIRNKAKASMAWPVAPGHVVSSELTRRRDNDGESVEEARVVYAYEVAGTSFQGSRISFGGSGSVGARKCVEQYPAGAAVQVFYDPAKPASAVLQRSAGGSAFVLPLVGGAFAIVGVVLLATR